MAENLSVSWEEYQKNICKGLGALQQRGEFVDMTLAADGHHVKVHQMVMSLVSPFIKELITSANCPHPVIFLNRVSNETMQSILEYAYTGEVVVRKDKMGEFLEACKDLHIRGLDNMLKDAHSTVNKAFTAISNTQNMDDWNSGNRKRKKQHNEVTFEDTSHFTQDDDDDDFPQAEQLVDEEVPITLSSKTENEQPTEIFTHTTPDTTENKSAMLQYSVSCQGNLQLMVNRYLYALRHIRKNDTRFWRCIGQQTSGCPAIVTTLSGQILERSFPHNHAFHDAQILKRVKKGNMFTSLSEVETAAAAKKKKKQDADFLQQAFNDTG